MSKKGEGKSKKIKVIFIPRRSRIRPYKMAKALKYTGKVELILLCEESFYDKELFDDIFDEVHFFTKKNILFKLPKAEKIYRKLNERIGFGFNRMIRKINDIQPDLVHCFAEPYNHIVHVLKNTNFPVIMSDGADFTGITEGIENLKRHTLIAEKYCFENVDGLIYKGPKQVTEYYRKMGYKIDCKELSWFDHADMEMMVVNNYAKDSQKDGHLHFVYTGNISTTSKLAYCYYIPLAKILSEKNINFHIYPNPWQYSISEEYLELSKSDKYFHFHKPLALKDLISEISKFDYGLWVHSEEESQRTKKSKMKIGMVNKMFTYFEAELPVIVSDSREYGASFVTNEQVGFSVKDDEWNKIDEILERHDINQLIRNVRVKRKTYSLQENSSKLLLFYNKIIKIY